VALTNLLYQDHLLSKTCSDTYSVLILISYYKHVVSPSIVRLPKWVYSAKQILS